ncbi:4,5:9,10-diseco-3-hydroxy-5,9, 17-trioxoandrosta-1(10),2-diene-4-oate hydrolase [bacterium HR23]|nr:4,5:9,10-diseco-3-hydroxy-5,9, 17-trioxoandrosta-1(10),2-diene-4-oate hydrolase [bacterium HR23]
MSGAPSAVVSPDMHRWVTVLGRRVHLVAVGAGTPVLLLHGLGASWVAWEPLLPRLAPHLRVFAPDLPGHGDSDPLRPYSLDNATPWMEGLLEALGIERVVVVGNSLGGLIALHFTLERPRRVSHLVLVDSAGLGREVALSLRLATLPVIGEMLEAPSERGTQRLLRRLVFADPRLITPALVTELTRVRSRPGAKATVLEALRYGIGLGGIKRHVLLLHRLREVACPILVVWGGQDAIFPVGQALRAREIAPHVRVAVFPRSGHWPHYEEPDAFARLLLEFLGKG